MLAAFGYVRCCLPDDWLDRCVIANRSLSPVSQNELHRAQRNVIRQYARIHDIYVWRVFSDLEKEGPITLPYRTQLAKLLAAAGKEGIRQVIVDRSERLAEDAVVLGVLLKHFQSFGVSVIEATTSIALSDDQLIGELLHSASPSSLSQASKLVGLLKARATRLNNGTTPGRRPFGSIQEERDALNRLLELTRILSKNQWKRRGSWLMVRRSFSDIAETLNREGYPTRTGRPWTAGVVRDIIRREREWLVRKWSRWIGKKGR